jgi:hypothetical protein
MVQAVRDLPPEIQAIIDIREWDMRTPDAVRRFKEHLIKRLPSIAIDGRPVFESIIPDQEELAEAIVCAYNGKSGHRDWRL